LPLDRCDPGATSSQRVVWRCEGTGSQSGWRRGARRETEGKDQSSPVSRSRLPLQLGGPAKRSGMALPTASGLSGSGSGGQQQITRPRPVPASIAALAARHGRHDPAHTPLSRRSCLRRHMRMGELALMPDESLRWKPRDEHLVLARAGLLDRCAGRCCPWS
jgi:hypothetical protein